MNTIATTADIVAVGSGHNGLVAAAYLAAAGKKVLVLERNAWFGGGVVSRELTLPGFRHDQHSMSHIFIQANPLLKNDELGLKSRYGLDYIFPEVPMMSVFEDGSTLKLYRDREKSAAEIAKAIGLSGTLLDLSFEFLHFRSSSVGFRLLNVLSMRIKDNRSSFPVLLNRVGDVEFRIVIWVVF